MKLGTLAIFIPDEWLPLIFAAAGLAWIIGARKLACSMMLFVILSATLPPLLAPFIQLIPVWVLWLLLAYAIFLIPFAVVSVLQALVAPALGAKTASYAAGHWAAGVGRTMFLAPFKILGALFRLVAAAFKSKP
jgi:hypothetical protein